MATRKAHKRYTKKGVKHVRSATIRHRRKKGFKKAALPIL